MAARERRLNGLGSPERDRRNVPGDDLSEPFVPGRAGVRESALLEVSSFDPGACEHPEQTESVRRVTVISRLLEHGHQRLEVAPD